MSRNQKSNEEKRLAWLREHPALWFKVRLHPEKERSHCVNLGEHRMVAKAMKDAGLFSKKTYDLDIRVPYYIRLLREEKSA